MLKLLKPLKVALSISLTYQTSSEQGEHMTQCKHRWEPSNFGIKHRNPGSYWYKCARCNQVIWTILLEKQA